LHAYIRFLKNDRACALLTLNTRVLPTFTSWDRRAAAGTNANATARASSCVSCTHAVACGPRPRWQNGTCTLVITSMKPAGAANGPRECRRPCSCRLAPQICLNNRPTASKTRKRLLVGLGNTNGRYRCKPHAYSTQNPKSIDSHLHPFRQAGHHGAPDGAAHARRQHVLPRALYIR
jgi:hypothetical protein